MNSITVEVAISKNKRARHVAENNRFVLAGYHTLGAYAEHASIMDILKF